MTTRVKVTRKSHSRREGGRLKTYRIGDEFDATDREVSQLADRIEVVKDKPKRGPGRPKKAPEAAPEPEPTEAEVTPDGESNAE